MKVKLLKKVRRRFEIIECNQISQKTLKKYINGYNVGRMSVAYMTLPIYILKDKKLFSHKSCILPTPTLAKMEIIKILKAEKEEKNKKENQDIFTKIWHTNS